MGESLHYTYSLDIKEKEQELIKKVLENYELEFKTIEKIRSAYKISTDEKTYFLKMLGRGYKRAHKSYFLSTALREKGFDNLAHYEFTNDNKYLIKNKKSSFYITEWIDSNEVDFKNIDDILDCSRLLAEFHNKAKNLEIPENIKIRNKHNKWREIFNTHYETVQKFAGKIKGKSKSKFTGFDLLYKNNLHIFMDEANFAMRLLDTEESKRAFEAAERENFICHDSFYYQNILRDKTGKLYLVDLESSQLDCPMSDLGKLIRRIICKHKFKWDFDICRRIIDAYDSVRPISEDELYPLLAMLTFPHKFWKFGKKRYINKKDWTEEDYQNKLKKIIDLQKCKVEFVQNFMMFYNIRLN